MYAASMKIMFDRASESLSFSFLLLVVVAEPKKSFEYVSKRG